MLDAVGMDAHHSPRAQMLQQATGFLTDKTAKLVMEKASVDRTAVLHAAAASMRRGGTISLSGVYCGVATPVPMSEMFDKQIQLHQGQCNVRHWTEELLPMAEDTSDPLGLDDLMPHTVPSGPWP